MKNVIVIFLLLWTSKTDAQGIQLHFLPSYQHNTIGIDNWYLLASGDSILFEGFKCYVSDVCFYMDDRKVYAEKGSYHLLDIEDAGSMNINVHTNGVIHYNSIQFNLGIDSAVSASGAHGGDLDPTKGMYWTWQSGYINLKLEGKSNLCNTRGKRFQFHLGGYAKPDNALQQVQLRVNEAEDLKIGIAIDDFLQGIDLSKQNQVMIPGKEAVGLSKKAASCFKIVQ